MRTTESGVKISAALNPYKSGMHPRNTLIVATRSCPNHHLEADAGHCNMKRDIWHRTARSSKETFKNKREIQLYSNLVSSSIPQGEQTKNKLVDVCPKWPHWDHPTDHDYLPKKMLRVRKRPSKTADVGLIGVLRD